MLALLVLQQGMSAFAFAFSPPEWSWTGAMMLHHAIQAVLTIGILLLLARWAGIDIGFRIGDARAGARALAVVLCGTVVFLLTVHTAYALAGSPPPALPGRGDPIIGVIAFQLFFTGPSEELLFRALPIAVLAAIGSHRLIGRVWPLTLECLIAAALFALAHVPLSDVGSTDLGQVLTALVMGTIQGVVFQRTRSIVWPMLIHSLYNVLVVAAVYIVLALR